MARLLKRVLAPLAAVALAGTALAGAAPAQAAKGDCNSNEICLWVNTNYTGTRWYAGGTWEYGTCWNLPPSINNKASSAYNRRSREISIFDGANCTNQLGWVHVQDAYPNLNSLSDRVSSIRFERDF